jgi:hypothetical protein
MMIASERATIFSRCKLAGSASRVFILPLYQPEMVITKSAAEPISRECPHTTDCGICPLALQLAVLTSSGPR